MPDELKPGEMPTPEPGETPDKAAPAPNAAELAAQLADMQKQLKAVNRESAERRKALEAFEKAEAERKSAEMTEAQKLQAQLAALQKERDAALQTATERTIRAEVLAKAAQLFEHPEDVYEKLKAGLTVDDAGNVDGLDDALKALAKDRPAWLRRNPAAAALKATAPGPNGQTPPAERSRQRVDVFDPAFMRGKGGGVFFNTEG